MDDKILQHYKNWLQQHQNEEQIEQSIAQQPIVSESPEVQSEVQNENEHFNEFPQDSHSSVKVFENDQIEVYIKKTFHQRQKRFRLEDSMYHIKIKVKENTTQPLLFNLLDIFEKVFTFIL